MELSRAATEPEIEEARAEIELEHAAPSPLVYVVVAVILTVLTAMEVGVFYVSALRSVLVPLLIVLSGAKFTLVVMFYMHLRYDHLGYTAIFLPLLLLAALIICVLITLFAVFMSGL